jgi:hypothetical protein
MVTLGAQGRGKGAVLTPVEKTHHTKQIPARLCALEERWQVQLVLMDL